MNPYYTIMESPHRWLILAGIAFVAGAVGAMMMLAYAWPHWLARIWLLAGLVISVGFLVRALLDWKRSVEAELETEQRRRERQAPPRDA